MKITREALKNIVKDCIQEENEYQKFFAKALEKTGKSIPQMSDDEKKAFFNKIDSAWQSKGEKKNEGNAFGAAVADAKEKGEDEFEVDGKEYKVESVNEAKVIVYNEKTGERYEVLSGKGKGDLMIAMKALQNAAPSHMKYSLKESVNEATLEKGTKLRYEKNTFVVDYVVDKKYIGRDGYPKYILKVVKSNYPKKIKVGSTEEYEDARLKGLIRNRVMSFVKNESVNEAFKHTIYIDNPRQVASKKIEAEIEALAKKGIRSKEIGLKMGFVGNQKAATDAFQKIKNKVYFSLHKDESVNESLVTEATDIYVKGRIQITKFAGRNEQMIQINAPKYETAGDHIVMTKTDFIQMLKNSSKLLNQLKESVNEASIDIKVGDWVKVVDNPHWERSSGKKGPFRRKVKMIDHDVVFFTDGSNSSMKYIKK